MRRGMLRGRETAVRILASLLFHAGALKVLNLFANRFQARYNEEGQVVLPFVRKRAVKNVQILMYHRVNDEYDPFFPATPVHVFAKQMEYFATHCSVCSLEDAVARMQRRDLPDNAVVITFDDGYKDNYIHAFPILKRLAIPATIFLATDAIGSGKMLWHDKVFIAFRETRQPFLTDFDEAGTRYPLGTIAERVAAQVEVRKFLRSLAEDERERWIERLFTKLKVANLYESSDLMLTWDDVRVMRREGIGFGSHTITHPILSRLSVERMKEEIWVSKCVIEEQLETPVNTFAYPNGSQADFTETTKQFVHDAGYTCALTAIFGANDGHHDPFELRRVSLLDEDPGVLGLRLSYYKFCS